MVIHFTPLDEPQGSEAGKKDNKLNSTTALLKSEVKTAGHEQYVRELDLFIENKLAEEIRQIQCEMRKSIHFDTIYDTIRWMACGPEIKFANL